MEDRWSVISGVGEDRLNGPIKSGDQKIESQTDEVAFKIHGEVEIEMPNSHLIGTGKRMRVSRYGPGCL